MIKFLTNSRGAMFGMDARIAMMIFGALSIIVGYFSYSKVQGARNASLLRELENLHTAIQEFATDMGTFPLFAIDTSDGTTDFEALYDSSKIRAGLIPSWNGPYYTIESTNHKLYGTFSIEYHRANFAQNCTATTECFAWIVLTGVPANIWTSINRYVDESQGEDVETAGNEHLLGKVQADGTDVTRVLYYRTVERLR